MKRNEIFNIRRFGRYFTTDFKTCTANFGLSLLTISILIPVALYVLTIVFNGIFGQVWDGPGIVLRAFTFFIAIFCLTVTMPAKCYGKLTEKMYGAFWINLPASKLEKFLSMILMCCLVIPVIGISIYLILDQVLCLMDKTCGDGIMTFALSLIRDMGGIMDEIVAKIADIPPTEAEDMLPPDVMIDLFEQLTSPWLYIDEFIAMVLPFLLGAIVFKNNKIVKTFLALAAFSTIISMAGTPIYAGYYIELLNGAVDEEEMALRMFNSGLFRNIVWVDIISDTLTNATLLSCIWFRIKTLKY